MLGDKLNLNQCFVETSLHLLYCSQNVEGTDKVLVDVHKGSVILELSTVIRRCKDCYELPFP